MSDSREEADCREWEAYTPGGTRIRKCAFSLASPGCIYRQNPRNHASFRECDRIGEHAKTCNCRWDAGKLRAKIPRDSGARSGMGETCFCPHPLTPQTLSTLISTWMPNRPKCTNDRNHGAACPTPARRAGLAKFNDQRLTDGPDDPGPTTGPVACSRSCCSRAWT